MTRPPLEDLVRKARDVIGAMCNGAKWKMSIPVRLDEDFDIVLSDALDELERQLAAAHADREAFCNIALHAGQWVNRMEEYIASETPENSAKCVWAAQQVRSLTREHRDRIVAVASELGLCEPIAAAKEEEGK
jgi:hypothetical protein